MKDYFPEAMMVSYGCGTRLRRCLLHRQAHQRAATSPPSCLSSLCPLHKLLPRALIGQFVYGLIGATKTAFPVQSSLSWSFMDTRGPLSQYLSTFRRVEYYLRRRTTV